MSRFILAVALVGVLASSSMGAYIVIDDSDGGSKFTSDFDFTFTWDGGTWYKDTIVHEGATASPAHTAIWTFSGVESGLYSVYTTWPEAGNRTTHADFSIFDNTTLRGSVMVDETLVPTGGPTLEGTPFQGLATGVTVTSGILKVVLHGDYRPDNMNITVGDAVVIERTGDVPEPASDILLVSGLVGLLCYAWRKWR